MRRILQQGSAFIFIERSTDSPEHASDHFFLDKCQYWNGQIRVHRSQLQQSGDRMPSHSWFIHPVVAKTSLLALWIRLLNASKSPHSDSRFRFCYIDSSQRFNWQTCLQSWRQCELTWIDPENPVCSFPWKKTRWCDAFLCRAICIFFCYRSLSPKDGKVL